MIQCSDSPVHLLDMFHSSSTHAHTLIKLRHSLFIYLCIDVCVGFTVFHSLSYSQSPQHKSPHDLTIHDI